MNLPIVGRSRLSPQMTWNIARPNAPVAAEAKKRLDLHGFFTALFFGQQA